MQRQSILSMELGAFPSECGIDSVQRVNQCCRKNRSVGAAAYWSHRGGMPMLAVNPRCPALSAAVTNVSEV